jgi:C4-dicarboxylate transporter DctM subunit
MIGMMLMYIILACFLDILSVMVTTLPIILPTLKALGYDFIWFGVLMVHLMGIVTITLLRLEPLHSKGNVVTF